MSEHNHKYQVSALLLALIFLLSSFAPLIAQCSMMLNGECQMEISVNSDCCNPLPMDCHDADDSEANTDYNCINCECGYTSASSSNSAVSSVFSQHDALTVSDYHISYMYHKSGQAKSDLSSNAEILSPPIYLLVSSFLI